jgi:hypothetical protein
MDWQTSENGTDVKPLGLYFVRQSGEGGRGMRTRAYTVEYRPDGTEIYHGGTVVTEYGKNGEESGRHIKWDSEPLNTGRPRATGRTSPTAGLPDRARKAVDDLRSYIAQGDQREAAIVRVADERSAFGYPPDYTGTGTAREAWEDWLKKW